MWREHVGVSMTNKNTVRYHPQFELPLYLVCRVGRQLVMCGKFGEEAASDLQTRIRPPYRRTAHESHVCQARKLCSDSACVPKATSTPPLRV